MFPFNYFKLANYKDLLLLIAQLKEQLCEAMEELADCQGHPDMGQGPKALFWLLVAMVVTSAGLGAMRVFWHAHRDGRFIVDR